MTNPESHHDDLEIETMTAAYTALRRLTPDECARALWWLTERLNHEHRAKATGPTP